MINELIFAGLIGELPSCVKKKKKGARKNKSDSL